MKIIAYIASHSLILDSKHIENQSRQAVEAMNLANSGQPGCAWE
jgi:hypothetical protein